MMENWTLLLAEDQEADVFFMERALKELPEPPLLQVAHNGNEIISYLKGEGKFADREAYPWPKLVILDLKMPACSGFDVLEWVLRNPEYRVVPTLIWSSSGDPQDVKHAFCLGAHGYLTKPADFHEFKRMIQSAVEFWSLTLVPPPPGSGPSCHGLQPNPLRLVGAEVAS